jgi:hypothetical protein
MADKYAANYYKPTRELPQGQLSFGGSWTADSGTSRLLTTDIVYLGILPAGAQVQGVTYHNTQLGAGVSLSVGFAGVTTAIASAVDANTARSGTIVGYVTTLAADTALIATITGGVTVSSGTFGAIATYTMDPANAV